MEPFHEVLSNYSNTLTNFTKVMGTFTEMNWLSGGDVNLQQNEMWSKFFENIMKETRETEKLNAEVSQIISYKKNVDISKADVPTLIKCRYIATRSDLIHEIEGKTQDLSAVIQLTENSIDLAQTVMQILDKSSSSVITSRLTDLKQHLKDNANKKQPFSSGISTDKPENHKWLNILMNIERILSIGASISEKL
uniref:Helo_like_N domain-containing protein n=1 Tax=Syphacia muris TaxID=451379 RepID=A0A0N5AIA8_9BILA